MVQHHKTQSMSKTSVLLPATESSFGPSCFGDTESLDMSPVATPRLAPFRWLGFLEESSTIHHLFKALDR